MNIKWNFEINRATDNKDRWLKLRELHFDRYNKGYIIPYYGLLDGKIICECSVAINPLALFNSNMLIGDKKCYLFAVRTVEEYQGQGYFRELFKYVIEDLKKRGFEKVTIGVEKDAIKNKKIYFNYGFTEFLRENDEIYPDGFEVHMEYYCKTLNDNK